MNTLLLILLFVIILISLWTFVSAFKEERQLPPGGRSISAADEISREILTEKIDQVKETGTSQNPRRRKTDFTTEDDTVAIDEDFHVPYPADAIIPQDSPFKLYKQALYNAQEFSQKGDFATALSFYEGVKNRVSDAAIREKIEEDIDYLHNYHQIAATRTKTQKQKQHSFPNELKVSIDGIDRLPEVVNIDLAPKPELEEREIEDLIEKISDKIYNTNVLEDALQKALATNTNIQKLHQYQTDITELKNEIEHLHQIKNTISEQHSELLAKDKETINQLQQKVEELGKNREESQELALLKDRVEVLKKQQENNQEVQLLKNQIEALKKQHYNEKLDEIETLRKNVVHTIQQQEQEKIRGKEKENTELQEKLTSLQDEVSELEEYKTKSSQLEETLQDFINQNLQANNDVQDAEEKTAPQPAVAATAPTGMISSSITPATPPAGEATLNLQKAETVKDKKEDFELLSDYVKGEQYEEPDEDEIYEKILRDAVKDRLENSEDIDIKGNHKKEKQIDYDNLVYIEKESSQKDEEEFYDKFSKYYNRKKKELPILKVSYNFSKLPDASSISHEKNVMAHSFYKYKPMLEKANEYIKMHRVRDAINYYQVVLDQKIPEEFKIMIKKNIEDLNHYLEKYLFSG